MTTHSRSWSAITVLAFATLALFVLISTHARAAGPWYATPGGSDGNSCLSPAAACATINGAIGKATAGDTIKVATGTYTSSAGSEVVLIDKDLTLSGGWDASFTGQSGRSTIDGEGARRGITLNNGLVVTIERFVIQNGSTGSSPQFPYGGGLFNGYGSTMTLNNSIVRGNISQDSCGGIVNGGTLTLNSSTVGGNASQNSGGGICNGPTLILNNSTVSNNTSRNPGGGIWNDGGVVVINQSIIDSNTSLDGGGGGIATTHGSVTLNNSTVRDNLADVGGGISNASTLTLNNSTVSGNTSQNQSYGGGGIWNNDGAVTLNNSTVSGNTGHLGGGIYNYSGGITLQNSILAGNTSTGAALDCYGIISSSGYNLFGTISGCTFTPGSGDLTNTDANLGILIGSPGYHPLLAGSPAINAGNPAGCTDNLGDPLNTDQRGAARVGRCDIGAYEYTLPGSAASVIAIGGTPQNTLPFGVFGLPLRAAVLDSIGSPVSNAEVTFTAPASGASGTFADSGTRMTTALTNASGVATAAIFTANGVLGSYLVTGTVSGVINPANFLLGNLAWYVAPNGNDSHDCQMPATPCATINGALTKDGFLAGDTVFVANGVYTVNTGTEVVLIAEDVTLSGGWDISFTTQTGMATIESGGVSAGIRMNSSVTVTIERFIVQNNNVGIYNFDGTLTLNNSTISNNGSTGIFNGENNTKGTLTLNNSTVSGNNGGGIFNANGTVTLNSSTVSENNSSGIYTSDILILNNSTISGNVGGTGGGIHIAAGIVTLNNSVINNNRASYGGGLYNNGTVLLSNSTVSGNNSSSNGGGISNHGHLTLDNSYVISNTMSGYDFGYGGGISNSGVLTVTHSTIMSNMASQNGGGLYNWGVGLIDTSNIISNTAGGAWGFLPDGGGIYNAGVLTLSYSLISRNHAMSRGGGIFNNGNLVINDSTISSNKSEGGGGGGGGGGILNSGDVNIVRIANLNNVTLVNNVGGGLSNVMKSVINIRNTILAGNRDLIGQKIDCWGSLTSQGYNLIQSTTDCTIIGDTTGNLIGVYPILDPLRDNGGPTLTHALRPESPAINAGNPAGCTDSLGNPLTADQRAWPRIGRCDIGAYESFANKQVTGLFKAGGVVTYTISLNNLGGVTTFPGMTMTDTVPISMTYVPDSFFATSGTGGESGGVITWTGTIGTNTETLLTFAAAISPTLPVGSVITNTAQINWNGLTIQTIAQFDTFLKHFLPLIQR